MQLNQLESRVMVVSAKQPFLDWLQETAKKTKALNMQGVDKLSLETLSASSRAYILPFLTGQEETTAYLQKHYRMIFENELRVWNRHEKFWPKDRSLESFIDFFEVDPHDVVLDLVSPEIVDTNSEQSNKTA